MHYIGLVLIRIIGIYIWFLIARALLSWLPFVAPNFKPKGMVAAIFEVVFSLTDPAVKFAQRLIPPLRVGNVGLDLGFMLVFFALVFLQRLIAIVFF